MQVCSQPGEFAVSLVTKTYNFNGARIIYLAILSIVQDFQSRGKNRGSPGGSGWIIGVD